MPKKILVTVDMGELAGHLVEYGHNLAHRLDVEVSFINVLPGTYIWKGYETWIQPDILKEAHASAHKKIEYFIRKAEEKYPELPKHEHRIFLGQGNAAEVIIETAKNNGVDLIIIGFKGESTIREMVVGSTTTNVARYAHCSVLIYRPGFDPF